MKRVLINIAIFAICFGSSHLSHAKGVQFNLLQATPVGSSQTREEIDTDHKGRRTGRTVKTTMLGSEKRGGKKHYWIEMVIDNFKISKKGKRKPQGKRGIVKALIPASVMNGDPANVMGNIRGFGVETIIQTGKEDPIIFRNTGGFLEGITKAVDLEINYDFQEVGNEEVTVAAGTYNAKKITGSGSAEAKIVFKKIHVKSENTVWISSKVPFGTVRLESVSINGKKEMKTSSQLMEMSKSGGASLITKEPKEMPSFRNIMGGNQG